MPLRRNVPREEEPVMNEENFSCPIERKNRCLKRHKVQHHRKRYPSRYTPIILSLLQIVDLLNTIWARTTHCDTAGVKGVWSQRLSRPCLPWIQPGLPWQ